MINIMYLVLTALLALNVSAEIFNAFKVVDDGLVNSNNTLDDTNSKLPAIINKRAEAKKEMEKYADRTAPAQQFSTELSEYIDGIVEYMVDQAGDKDGTAYSDGDYQEYRGHKTLKGYKNKDITTRYLVDEGKGAELKDKLLEYREKFLSLIDTADRAQWESKIALTIDDESWRNSLDKSKDSWEDFNFRQMPLAATLPIFSKFKNDAKSSEAAVLNYLMGKVGGEDVVLDQFTVVSAPKKSYVIRGESFETEVFLSASASQASNTGVAIAVNGRSIPVDDNGVAKWSAPASSVGIKQYTATATVTNPVTGEVKQYTNEFEFEVGERSVTVSPTKMNVFYMGVDNPVEISAAGVPSAQVQVSMTGAGGGKIKRNSDGTFTVNVAGPPTRPNEFANIVVNAPGLTESRQFRVKRIPDPVARLSTQNSGAMTNGEFKAQLGVGAYLDNFDFDAKCQIDGFRLVRVAQRSDPEFATNGGGRYRDEARRLVDKARPGDRYFFENVKARCPGDEAGRTINSMVFTIR